ncbi:MAG: hypothetical protein ING75_03930 [Rhodocyclaceae bacterium]|nr:hypothetical protein [Rhodocyclaceae bacterium]
MPRRPRIHLDGVPLHIVQRGHNREPCFFGEDDYIRLALNQSQPLGNARFYAKIESMTGVRREARPRGRPRLGTTEGGKIEGQGAFEL